MALFRKLHALALLVLVPAIGLMPGTRAQDLDAPTVLLVSDPSLGTRLVDPEGWTLYTWSGDAPAISNCTEECASEWPPFSGSDSLTPPDGLPGMLGTIIRPDGTPQVVYDDAPLYYYRDDAQPGDTLGDGRVGAGARWSVGLATLASVPPAQTPTAVPASPTAVALPTATRPVPTQAPQATSTPAAPSSVAVSIQGFAFQPSSITVAAGGTVRWTNRDTVPHTSTGDRWNSGSIAPGGSTSQTVSTPGQYPYHCAIHPTMMGTITVI